jgi:hypothetical protein
MQALSSFLDERVHLMQDRQFEYNDQGLRHDGNYDLARRALARDGQGQKSRPYSVVMGFCGVDGWLLAPITLSKTELVGHPGRFGAIAGPDPKNPPSAGNVDTA